MTNLSCITFLIKSLSTTFLSLFKCAGTGFSLSKSNLSTSSFKKSKSDFAAKLQVGTTVSPFKRSFVV